MLNFATHPDCFKLQNTAEMLAISLLAVILVIIHSLLYTKSTDKVNRSVSNRSDGGLSSTLKSPSLNRANHFLTVLKIGTRFK